MSANPVFTDPNNALLKDRLQRISEALRNLNLPTFEEYQAAVYSAVNSVFSLGVAMTPLSPIGAEGPATVGDASNNFTGLNNDSEDIANELLRIEDAAASLFNLAATSQNQLRQQIREFIFAPNRHKYIEDFLNASRLPSVTANLDFNAGLATNALLDEKVLSPVFTAGINSLGSLDPNSSFDNLSDSRADTAMTWNGVVLELLISFPSPEIINRININLDTYNELEIETLVTSPDGTLIEDVLKDLSVDRILINGTSGKFSGDIIIDFPPRHAAIIRVVITDRTGVGIISLRELSVTRRRYSSSGQLTTAAISNPIDSMMFTTVQNVFSPYVSITHQISSDNVSFSAITPGTIITPSSSPFYYRAVLERSSSKFDSVQGPLAQSPLDPISSPNYQLVSTTTIPLGNGIIERTVFLNNITGPIVIRETPLPNTLQIQEGAIILNKTAGDYTFANGIISFPTPITGVLLTYQTTSLGAAAIKDREEYYTALLYEFKFEKN